MSSGRFARCDGCNEQMILYPEKDWQCASCFERATDLATGVRAVLKSSNWFDTSHQRSSLVVEWARRTPGKKLAIIDEATTLLNYQRRMRPVFGELVSKLRDAGVKVVLVVDEVPKWADEWGATCIDKTDVTTAEIYTGSSPVEVTNISPTNCTYDSCEMTRWSR